MPDTEAFAMKISASMLFDSMFSAIRSYSLDSPSTECCISGILPYLPDIPMASDHAYVISADNLRDIQPDNNITLIIYGLSPDSSLPLPNCQYIALYPEISFGEALALALGAMEKYNSWYENMRAELTGSPDLNNICSIGYQLLNNPILLFDPNHVLLASTDVAQNHKSAFLEINESSSTLVFSDDAYKAIVNRPEFEDNTEIGMVSFMKNPLGGNTLYTNIVCNQQEYRLCVNDTNRGFRPGDLQICKILSDTLQTAMEMDRSRETAAKADLCDLFISIISNDTVDPASCDSILAAWNWKRNDDFICLGVEKTNINLQFVSNDQYICAKIEELLSDACAFMLGGKLICIAHLNRDLNVESIPERLESFLLDNIFIVGESDVFSDALNAADYYREACIALRSGRAKNPDEFFHNFSDYSFYNLLHHGLDSLSPIRYCDKNVLRLAALEDSRVNYCETLRTYIENDRNLLRTAELLHIHRTTLFYRLNKIKEALDVDLEDPDTRLRIWLSFILLELDKSGDIQI